MDRYERKAEFFAYLVPQIGNVRLADRVGARCKKNKLNRVGGTLHGVFYIEPGTGP